MATYESIEAEVKDLAGIRAVIATPRALYRLKKDTPRPIDHQDAAELRERFGLDEGDG